MSPQMHFVQPLRGLTFPLPLAEIEGVGPHPFNSGWSLVYLTTKPHSDPVVVQGWCGSLLRRIERERVRFNVSTPRPR